MSHEETKLLPQVRLKKTTKKNLPQDSQFDRLCHFHCAVVCPQQRGDTFVSAILRSWHHRYMKNTVNVRIISPPNHLVLIPVSSSVNLMLLKCVFITPSWIFQKKNKKTQSHTLSSFHIASLMFPLLGKQPKRSLRAAQVSGQPVSQLSPLSLTLLVVCNRLGVEADWRHRSSYCSAYWTLFLCSSRTHAAHF